MLLSVCIITYNHRNYISQAITGALNQVTNFPFEIIIYDDHSFDGTSEICNEFARKYPNLIKYYCNDFNIGPVKNFKKAIKTCCGRFIAICEGDDYWIDNNKLHKQVDFLLQNEDYGMVHSNAHILLNNKKLIKDFYKNTEPFLINNDKVSNAILNKSYPIFTCTTCLRTKFIETYLDDTEYDNFLMADTPLWFEISKVSKVFYLDQSTAIRRLTRGSLSNSHSRKKNLDFLLNGLSCLSYIFNKHNVDLSTQKVVYEETYKNILINAFLAKDYNIYKKYYEELVNNYFSTDLSYKLRFKFYNFGSKCNFCWVITYLLDIIFRIIRIIYRRFVKYL